MLNYFIVFLVGLATSVVIGFPILKLCKKFHLSQTILHYVDKHSGKGGTPTMGGWIFMLATLFACAFFLKGEVFTPILCLFTMLGYGMLGFLDDFIKVKFHKNEGLKPYQKIIGQVGLATIIAVYTYLKVGTSLDLFGFKLELGWGIIPFVIVFFVAVTNSVNLIDGLDGLCTGTSGSYLLFFGLIAAVLAMENYAVISFAMLGSLIGYYLFNCFPAKIFMGDTGSLGLGGLIASLAVFTGLELILPIIGILYVLTAASDILQVGYYKRTHKRIFKMAPLHHHFEALGMHENRIVAVYIVITLVCGMATLLGYLSVAGVI